MKCGKKVAQYKRLTFHFSHSLTNKPEVLTTIVRGAVASWSVRSTPEVRALAEDIVLCSYDKLTLIVSLSSQGYKWLPATRGNRWTRSHPGRGGNRNSPSRFMLEYPR